MARRVGFGGDPGADDGWKKPKLRIFVGLFLTAWLVMWSYGIFLVASTLMSETGAADGAGQFAMVIWLIFAVLGLLFGIRILSRILRGEPPLKRKPVDPNAPPPQQMWHERPENRDFGNDGSNGGEGGGN